MTKIVVFFFLIPVEGGDAGFIIEECLTGERYKAILNLDNYSITTGGVFSTLKSPGLSNTYANLVCYSIVEPINSSEWDFVNLPILQPGPIQSCALCELWINPKVWSTTKTHRSCRISSRSNFCRKRTGKYL